MKKIFLLAVLIINTFVVHAQNTKIHVKLTGGKNAGTYDVTSAETTCSCNISKGIAFGNQYSIKDGPSVTSLQLIAPDRTKAIRGTDVFYIKVAFGKRLIGPKYELGKESMTVTEKATGTLKLSETTNSTIATITGTTKDGVKIELKLECFKLMTSAGTEVTKCK
jgi:hypothetical protein